MKPKLDRRLVAVAGVIAAVALPTGASAGGTAATAAESNEEHYADTGADGGCCAPDVTDVTVSNDDRGDLTFRVSFANRPVLAAEDWVAVVIEADDDESTGSHGWDYVFEYSGGEADLFAWDGEDWVAMPSPLLLTSNVETSAGSVAMTVNQDDIGGGTDLAFYVLTGAEGSEDRDAAPDGDDVWGYDVRSPSLAVLDVDRPRRATAGRDYVVVMTVRGARSSGQTRCTGAVRGKALRGRGDLFRLVWLGPPQFERVSPQCTWRVPASARGAMLRGTITLVQDGIQVSRTFSIRVR